MVLPTHPTAVLPDHSVMRSQCYAVTVSQVMWSGLAVDLLWVNDFHDFHF